MKFTDKKILPFAVDVELRAYQNMAFPLGVIKGNIKDYDICLASKYINCVRSEGGGISVFDDDPWSDRDGIISVQKLELNPDSLTYSGIDIIELNKSMISNGHYIIGFYDDFYIPGKVDYKRFNHKHDYILFGFDDEKKTFKSAAYMSDRNYREYEIKYEDYLSALTSVCIDKVIISYCRVNTECEINIKIDKIKRELNNYLHSRPSQTQLNENYSFGLNAWYDFSNDILSADRYIDMRYARLYMEHRNLMLLRIETLKKLKLLECDYDTAVYREIAQKAEQCYFLVLKYNLAGDCSIKRRIADLIRENTATEKTEIEFILNALK